MGAIGVFLTIRANQENRKLKTITWCDLQLAAQYFWRELKHQKYTPTFIVTPGQKGGIVAQLVRDCFDVKIPIITGYLMEKGESDILSKSSATLSTTKWDVHIPPVIENFAEKGTCKLLVVDDFVMSGDFMSSFLKWLLDLGYSEGNIRSCAVATTKVALDANKAPTLFWRIVDDREFYFPWGKAK